MENLVLFIYIYINAKAGFPSFNKTNNRNI